MPTIRTQRSLVDLVYNICVMQIREQLVDFQIGAKT